MKIYFTVCLLCITSLFSYGIENTADSIPTRMLKVGDYVPDLTLPYIINFPVKSAKISELNDKLLILDFWTTWCVPCIQAFPKVDSLQKKFKDDVLFMPVNIEDREKTERFMARIASHKLFDLPTAVDTTLFRFFREKSDNKWAGQYVWVRNGKVFAYSGSKALTEENITAAINGQPITHSNKVVLKLLEKDFTKPLLVDNMSKNMSSSYFSAVSPYISSLEKIVHSTINDQRIGLRVINNSLFWLYRFAYNDYLESPNRVILEVADVRKFKPFDDPADTINLICYEKVAPIQDVKVFREEVRRDLKLAFGYRVSKQMRQVDCAIIKRIKGFKHISFSDSSYSESNNFYLSFKNKAFSEVIDWIGYYLLSSKLPYLIDETNLKRNVDIEIAGDLSDIHTLKRELKRIGFELTVEKRLMEMTIVSDPERTTFN